MDSLWKWIGRVSKIIPQLTSRVESDKKFPHLIVHPDENGVGHSHKPVLRPRSRRGRWTWMHWREGPAPASLERTDPLGHTTWNWKVSYLTWIVTTRSSICLWGDLLDEGRDGMVRSGKLISSSGKLAVQSLWLIWNCSVLSLLKGWGEPPHAPQVLMFI